MRIAKKNLSLTEAAPIRPTVRVCRAWMNLLQKYQNTIKTQNKIAKMGEELPILKGILKGNVNYHNARKLIDLSIDYCYQTQTPAPNEMRTNTQTFYSLDLTLICCLCFFFALFTIYHFLCVFSVSVAALSAIECCVLTSFNAHTATTTAKTLLAAEEL